MSVSLRFVKLRQLWTLNTWYTHTQTSIGVSDPCPSRLTRSLQSTNRPSNEITKATKVKTGWRIYRVFLSEEHRLIKNNGESTNNRPGKTSAKVILRSKQRESAVCCGLQVCHIYKSHDFFFVHWSTPTPIETRKWKVLRAMEKKKDDKTRVSTILACHCPTIFNSKTGDGVPVKLK